MIKIKAVTHVHSQYSDSLASLPRIKREAQKYGINCVFMADHLFRLADFRKFIQECEALSDENFLIVQGIEIGSSEGYHFLAYNIEKPPLLADKKCSSQEICDAFAGKENLFVLAHASLYKRPPGDSILNRLDGIEVWNTKYDTKFAPNLKALKLAKAHKLIPLAAVDAHGRFCLKRLWLELEAERLDKKEIIGTLKKGNFLAATSGFAVDLNQELEPKQKRSFKRRNHFYSAVRYPVCAFVRSNFNFPEPVMKFLQKTFKWV